MATQLAATGCVGGSIRRTVILTPQARRLLEGPVLPTLLGLATTAAMRLFGRTFYAALGATGPALEAAVLYSDLLFLGAVPFWLFNAAASVLRGGGNTGYPAAAGAVAGLVTLAVSPLVIFGAGPVPGLGIAGAAGAVVAYNVAMATVLLRAVWAPGSPLEEPTMTTTTD